MTRIHKHGLMLIPTATTDAPFKVKVYNEMTDQVLLKGHSVIIGSTAVTSDITPVKLYISVSPDTHRSSRMIGIISSDSISPGEEGWACICGLINYALVYGTQSPGNFLGVYSQRPGHLVQVTTTGNGNACAIILESTSGATSHVAKVLLLPWSI